MRREVAQQLPLQPACPIHTCLAAASGNRVVEQPVHHRRVLEESLNMELGVSLLRLFDLSSVWIKLQTGRLGTASRTDSPVTLALLRKFIWTAYSDCMQCSRSNNHCYHRRSVGLEKRLVPRSHRDERRTMRPNSSLLKNQLYDKNWLTVSKEKRALSPFSFGKRS